jgi:hypothetical protein
MANNQIKRPRKGSVKPGKPGQRDRSAGPREEGAMQPALDWQRRRGGSSKVGLDSGKKIAGKEGGTGGSTHNTGSDKSVAAQGSGGDIPVSAGSDRLVAAEGGAGGVNPVTAGSDKPVAGRGDPGDGDTVRKPAVAAAGGRAGKGVSKQDAVIARLRSPRGATVARLMEITGWQKHTMRGFLSGVVRGKLGLTLASETGRDGERRYRIVNPGGEGDR